MADGAYGLWPLAILNGSRRAHGPPFAMTGNGNDQKGPDP